MCTAVSWQAYRHYFGRTLDLEYTYAEQVVITPRRFPLPHRHLPQDEQHHAIIGIATVMDGYPLYYDAVNEYGLAMAGLNFVGNAVYAVPQDGAVNVAQFELLPHILGRCRTVAEARRTLAEIRVTDTAFSAELPTAQLHWMLADAQACVTLEITADGMQQYDNPVGVLTNNPPFPYQLWHLTQLRRLDAAEGDNTLAPNAPLRPHSHGTGAVGMPGDLSSSSRFVRAAFARAHAVKSNDEPTAVSQFFHILGNVWQTEGCVITNHGCERTQYASCCNTHDGIYYYRTYHNSRTTAVCLRHTDLDARTLTTFPLRTNEMMLCEN